MFGILSVSVHLATHLKVFRATDLGWLIVDVHVPSMFAMRPPDKLAACVSRSLGHCGRDIYLDGRSLFPQTKHIGVFDIAVASLLLRYL